MLNLSEDTMKLSKQFGHYMAEIRLPIGRHGVAITGWGETEVWAYHRALMQLRTVQHALYEVDQHDCMDAVGECDAIISAALDDARERALVDAKASA